MTKVVLKKVRCAKCGIESNQKIVHSVNFFLSKKENNEKLISKKQVCPNCNYTSIDISVVK